MGKPIYSRDGFSGQFFLFFKLFFFFCFVVAICDLVNDVEAIHDLCSLQTASENLSIMSDAHETAICSFTGITHILEKISRCC